MNYERKKSLCWPYARLMHTNLRIFIFSEFLVYIILQYSGVAVCCLRQNNISIQTVSSFAERYKSLACILLNAITFSSIYLFYSKKSVVKMSNGAINASEQQFVDQLSPGENTSSICTKFNGQCIQNIHLFLFLHALFILYIIELFDASQSMVSWFRSISQK